MLNAVEESQELSPHLQPLKLPVLSPQLVLELDVAPLQVHIRFLQLRDLRGQLADL